MKYFIDTEFLEGPQKTFWGQTKPTIDLISIGIVAEDGREYYAISKDFNLREAWNRYDLKPNTGMGDANNLPPTKVYWIRNNVIKTIWEDLSDKEYHLTSQYGVEHPFYSDKNFTYREVKRLIGKYGKTNNQIAQEIVCFVNNTGIKHIPFDPMKHPPFQDKWSEPEFYAYYADYDWVAFCWLFGKMMDLPKGFPMYCRDLKQMIDEVVQRSWKDVEDITYGHEGYTLESLKKRPEYPKQSNEHNALDDARWNKKLHDFLNNL
jgi:hypothetical protein